MSEKKNKEIGGPALVIGQDNNYREMLRSGIIPTMKDTEEACPCKWSDSK